MLTNFGAPQYRGRGLLSAQFASLIRHCSRVRSSAPDERHGILCICEQMVGFSLDLQNFILVISAKNVQQWKDVYVPQQKLHRYHASASPSPTP